MVSRPNSMDFCLFSSNCSHSLASWSRGLVNAKSTAIVRRVITLDSSIKALLLTSYLLHSLNSQSSIGLRNCAFGFKMKTSLCRVLCRISHVKLYCFTVLVLALIVAGLVLGNYVWFRSRPHAVVFVLASLISLHYL